MHQYKIIYWEYSDEGALTSRKHVLYADTAEQAQNRFEELNAQYRDVFDPETGEKVRTVKAYKVTFHVATYKQVEDAAAFFAQFGL